MHTYFSIFSLILGSGLIVEIFIYRLFLFLLLIGFALGAGYIGYRCSPRSKFRFLNNDGLVNSGGLGFVVWILGYVGLGFSSIGLVVVIWILGNVGFVDNDALFISGISNKFKSGFRSVKNFFNILGSFLWILVVGVISIVSCLVVMGIVIYLISYVVSYVKDFYFYLSTLSVFNNEALNNVGLVDNSNSGNFSDLISYGLLLVVLVAWS